MGRNYRKKSKWHRDDAGEAGQLGQRRLRRGPSAGSASASGMPEDGGDNDPESYTKPISRSRGRRGSGKLHGGSQDGSISSDTTQTSVKAPADGGNSIPLTEGADDQTSRYVKHTTDAEVVAESRTETDRDRKSLSTSTLHAESGLPGVSSDGETDSPVCALTPMDQDQDQDQSRSTEEDEKEGRGKDKENIAATSPDQLTAETNTKNEGDISGDDTFNNDNGSNPELRAPSTGRGVIVPALRFGSSHTNGDHGGETGRVRTAVVVEDDKPLSLAWAGGRTGRPLMKSVESVLSEWLCGQEAKVGEGRKSRYSSTYTPGNLFTTTRTLGGGSLRSQTEKSRVRGAVKGVRPGLLYFRVC